MNLDSDKPETQPQPKPIPLAIITCAVLEQEITHLASALDHIVHLQLIEQGLHNEPDKLRTELQLAITRTEENTTAQAIALGYGLCSRGIEGITTKRCKLVVTRAHDCLTLLLGSKDRYAEYLDKHPGTYWYSPGWNRHHTPPGKQRHDELYNQYLKKYGPDNAEYLMQTEQSWINNYNRATYVDLNIGVTDKDIQYTRDCAKWLNWQFDHQHGDPALLSALLNCQWDQDRFLVLLPGQRIRLTADQRIIEAVPEKPEKPAKK